MPVECFKKESDMFFYGNHYGYGVGNILERTQAGDLDQGSLKRVHISQSCAAESSYIPELCRAVQYRNSIYPRAVE